MSNAWEEMALVGRIARAHGTRGRVIVDPETDFPEERYKPDSIVYIRQGVAIEPMKITSVRFQRGRPVIALEGVETIDAAARLAGAELRVDAGSLQRLPTGTFYRHDLVGCAVETPDGTPIGVVTGVEETGAARGAQLNPRAGAARGPR